VKLTKSKLKQIIKEELREGLFGDDEPEVDDEQSAWLERLLGRAEKNLVAVKERVQDSVEWSVGIARQHAAQGDYEQAKAVVDKAEEHLNQLANMMKGWGDEE